MAYKVGEKKTNNFVWWKSEIKIMASNSTSGYHYSLGLWWSRLNEDMRFCINFFVPGQVYFPKRYFPRLPDVLWGGFAVFRRIKTCCRSVTSQVTFVICTTRDQSLDEIKKFRLGPAMVLGWLLAACVLGAAQTDSATCKTSTEALRSSCFTPAIALSRNWVCTKATV